MPRVWGDESKKPGSMLIPVFLDFPLHRGVFLWFRLRSAGRRGWGYRLGRAAGGVHGSLPPYRKKGAALRRLIGHALGEGDSKPMHGCQCLSPLSGLAVRCIRKRDAPVSYIDTMPNHISISISLPSPLMPGPLMLGRSIVVSLSRGGTLRIPPSPGPPGPVGCGWPAASGHY